MKKRKISLELYKTIACIIGSRTFILVDSFKDGVLGYIVERGSFDNFICRSTVFKDGTVSSIEEEPPDTIIKEIDKNLNFGLFTSIAGMDNFFEISKENNMRPKKVFDFRVNSFYNYGVLAESPESALILLVKKLLEEGSIVLCGEEFSVELIENDVMIPTEENPVVTYEER